ncbi:MAG: class I SAM-dependent methyltransferase [Ideonella sp.]|nr:class I SAM-dependent methyltransferase [Ideonella sp.]
MSARPAAEAGAAAPNGQPCAPHRSPAYLSPQPDVCNWCRAAARHPAGPERGAGTRRGGLVEVGCGAGGNLLEFLRAGFMPAHLTGCELLPERLATAREVLPESVRLLVGDASALSIAPASQDIVFQATVFSSLLQDETQERLAHAMWQWLKPGGAVLWYDFCMDNPRNRDVRGVPLSRVQALFPQGRLKAQRLTLAPPIARRICRLHPSLYHLFNALPLLRSHRLVWIQKS